jgi:hypothetical protein
VFTNSCFSCSNILALPTSSTSLAHVSEVFIVGEGKGEASHFYRKEVKGPCSVRVTWFLPLILYGYHVDMDVGFLKTQTYGDLWWSVHTKFHGS